jgi:hypothetical protein
VEEAVDEEENDGRAKEEDAEQGGGIEPKKSRSRRTSTELSKTIKK